MSRVEYPRRRTVQTTFMEWSCTQGYFLFVYYSCDLIGNQIAGPYVKVVCVYMCVHRLVYEYIFLYLNAYRYIETISPTLGVTHVLPNLGATRGL